MTRHWRRLNRETRLVLLLAVGFVVVRLTVATLSNFGFHQGWNEGHYALIARGFLDHPLVPAYGERFVYSVPPLFPYAVAGSFLAFGQSAFAARLPSIVAGGGLVLATYALGRELFDDRTALVGAALLVVMPYVQLYGGRAQTDMLMVCLTTAALAAIVRGYERRTHYRRWLALGGVLFAGAFSAKQPAIFLPAIVLAWLVGYRRFDHDTLARTGVLVGAATAALLPLAAWLVINYSQNPVAFLTDWRHELLARTVPFANVPLVILIGLGLGATPLVLASAAIGMVRTERADLVDLGRLGRLSPLSWWLLLFGAFVFVRTPHGHQYYALVLLPPVALLAARGLDTVASHLGTHDRETSVRLALTAVVLLSAATGTVVLFELSGEFSAAEGGGTQVTADASRYVAEEVPDDAMVLVENGYAPPVMWYVREDFPIEHVDAYHVRSLDEERIRTAVAESDGPVYLVYPQPAWGPDAEGPPVENATVVHRTDAYNYTIMARVGMLVDTDSKFTFYLHSRRLVIYRLVESRSR